MTTLADTEAASRLARHREERAAAAAAKRGPVSFFWGDFVTEPGTRVSGAPGTWAPREAGRPGLQVTATADDGILLGGRLVDGTADLFAEAGDGPLVAEFPDGAEGIVFSYDGTKHALQVWNPQSEWARRFAGISAYDHDPAWVVPAQVRLIDSDRTVALTHHRDPRPVDVPVLAEIRFLWEGEEHVLLGTGSGPGRGGITVLVSDATSGQGSYAAGRVLHLPEIAGHGHGRTQTETVLDFNYLSLLPCAFSLAWNCPIPPAENTLPIPIRAGERHAIDHDGRNIL